MLDSALPGAYEFVDHGAPETHFVDWQTSGPSPGILGQSPVDLVNIGLVEDVAQAWNGDQMDQRKAQAWLSELLNEHEFEVDIFLSEFDYKLGAEAAGKAIAESVLHELGHSLGLLHTADFDALRAFVEMSISSHQIVVYPRLWEDVLTQKFEETFDGSNHFDGWTLRVLRDGQEMWRAVTSASRQGRFYFIDVDREFDWIPTKNDRVTLYKWNVRDSREPEHDPGTALPQAADIMGYNSTFQSPYTKEYLFPYTWQALWVGVGLDDDVTGPGALDFYAKYNYAPVETSQSNSMATERLATDSLQSASATTNAAVARPDENIGRVGPEGLQVFSAESPAWDGYQNGTTQGPARHPDSYAWLYTGEVDPLDEIVNGAFDIEDQSNAAFGWDLSGEASVVGGQGVLDETEGFFSGMFQTFVVPADANALQFTIVSADLRKTPDVLPDTLEVALLDAATMQSVVGTAEGVADTDAFLNVQASGATFGAPTVSIKGLVTSGDVLPWDDSVTVVVDLSGVAAGTELTLYFDLLGFGPQDSTVILDDVRLVGTEPPWLTLGLDSASDSGILGDDLTNLSTVDLVGVTDPSQLVELDLDGDGQFESIAIASALGEFSVSGVALAEGPNTIAASAANSQGTSQADLMIELETQRPTVELLNPLHHSFMPDGPGYIEMRWSDVGIAGLDVATIDIKDIAVTGVSIDRAEQLGAGLVRYWYSDDSEHLPIGRVTITIAEDAVSDLAGNVPDDVATFQIGVFAAWQNPVFAVDVSANWFVEPQDALQVINRINARGNGPLPAPPVSPDVPPPFLDTSGNNYLEPLDVLLVINYLNGNGNGPVPDALPSNLAATFVSPAYGEAESEPADAQEMSSLQFNQASVPLLAHAGYGLRLDAWDDRPCVDPSDSDRPQHRRVRPAANVSPQHFTSSSHGATRSPVARGWRQPGESFDDILREVFAGPRNWLELEDTLEDIFPNVCAQERPKP